VERGVALPFVDYRWELDALARSSVDIEMGQEPARKRRYVDIGRASL
jgi:hypothetical protein